MPTLQLTPKMKLALDRLHEANGHEDWVNMYTGFALQKRGFVAVNTNTRRTAGGQFPEHITKLSTSGISWCQRRFANIYHPGKQPVEGRRS